MEQAAWAAERCLSGGLEVLPKTDGTKREKKSPDLAPLIGGRL
jgi:hypothetical protein